MASKLFHYHLNDRQLKPLIPGWFICGLFLIISEVVAAFLALIRIAVMDFIHLLGGQRVALLTFVVGFTTLLFSGFSFFGLFLCSRPI
ncbi:hypothetical protein [Desulfogranum marinum]|uniref:hypothetical protein n=1 Tax=Desulfogranum marinum TaxID=453220 RepID=UPI0029C620D7|nr:hypothetical protein [Desulfogranum marinum]